MLTGEKQTWSVALSRRAKLTISQLWPRRHRELDTLCALRRYRRPQRMPVSVGAGVGFGQVDFLRLERADN